MDTENINNNLNEIINPSSGAGFIIPENYFDELKQSVQFRISETEPKEFSHSEIKEIKQNISENYFDELKNKILSKINQEKDFENIPKIPAEHGFKTPVGYFKQSENEILQKISAPKIYYLRKNIFIRYRRIISVAASLIFVFGFILYFYFQNSEQQVASVEINHPPTKDEVQAALNNEDINEDMLIAYFPDENRIQTQPETIEKKSNEIDRKEIEKYLNEHNDESLTDGI